MKVTLFIPVVLIAVSAWLEFASGEPHWRFRFSGRRRRRRHQCRPEDCAVSRWCSWSYCSQPCGGKGVQTRSRDVESQEKCGGRCDYHLAESQPCNRFCHNGGLLVYSNLYCRCKTGFTGECCDRKKSVNGRWSKWSGWSQCSKTCGRGQKSRTRTCTNPLPANGGRGCTGPSKQTQNCYLKKSCAVVNGGWSKWFDWSAPSKTCGIVINGKYRTRTCTNPRPSNSGRQCIGRSKQYMTLFLRPCLVAVNGGWTDWSSWCKCSKTCGTGLQYRRRYCTKPKPAHGGKTCKGKDKLIKTCHLIACIPPHFHKGCFKDASSRAMPQLIANFRNHWDAVAKCAKKVFGLEYKCFGVQYGGECWSGSQAHRTYNKYNKCSKCKNGMGGPYANDVYCFQGVPGAPPPTSAPETLPPTTMKPNPTTMKPKPTTMKPKLTTMKPKPTTMNPNPTTMKPKPTTMKPKPTTMKPKPTTMNPKPTTMNPNPTTMKPNPTTKQDCWSPWVYSTCTKPCGCGYKVRTRFCKCGEGKFGDCEGLPMETFKCNCHQCGPPVGA